MVQDFLTMCRKIYVPIHGEEIVREVFSPLTEDKFINTAPPFPGKILKLILKIIIIIILLNLKMVLV